MDDVIIVDDVSVHRTSAATNVRALVAMGEQPFIVSQSVIRVTKTPLVLVMDVGKMSVPHVSPGTIGNSVVRNITDEIRLTIVSLLS
jgi:hypothetical protein